MEKEVDDSSLTVARTSRPQNFYVARASRSQNFYVARASRSQISKCFERDARATVLGVSMTKTGADLTILERQRLRSYQTRFIQDPSRVARPRIAPEQV